MHHITITFLLLLLSATVLADQVDNTANQLTSASIHSKPHRSALLELYTSQGCSSCPPAERFLSRLKASGISSQQLIPLAFHVTYWDYIGWRDRYGSERFDDRQRRIAAYNKQRTIYTPQFVLNGEDYRGYARFSQDVNDIISQPAVIKLNLHAQSNKAKQGVIDLQLEAAVGADVSSITEANLYLVLYENNLSDEIKDGENEGETLKHDYVVRQFYGPYKTGLTTKLAVLPKTLNLDEQLKMDQLGLVAFAQDVKTGEILQAVQLDLTDLK